MSFTYNNSTVNNIPIAPGAYFLNGIMNQTMNSFPIFCSMIRYDVYGISNQDDYYLVLPGFKLEVYTINNYTGNKTTIDNTNGTSPLYQGILNNSGNSCRLYYNNILIPDSFAMNVATPITGTSGWQSTGTIFY